MESLRQGEVTGQMLTRNSLLQGPLRRVIEFPCCKALLMEKATSMQGHLKKNEVEMLGVSISLQIQV